MIVCVCNNFNTQSFHEPLSKMGHIENPEPEDVIEATYKALTGEEPNCRRCFQEVSNMIKAHNETLEAQP